MGRFQARLLAVTALFAVGITLTATGCVERKASSVSGPASVDIVSITASPDTISIGQQSIITAVIDNPAGGELKYQWHAYRGSLNGTGTEVRYFGAYCCLGTDFVILTVTDPDGGRVTGQITLHVLPTAN
jgi:hypothetical protein